MPDTTTYTLTTGWDATNRYTAAAEVETLLGNPSGSRAFYAITTSDVAPTIAPEDGFSLERGEDRAPTLAANERIWFAGTAGAKVTFYAADGA